MSNDTIRPKEILFGDVLQQWLKHNQIRLKGGTFNKYYNLINTQIMPDLGSMELGSLTSTKINDYLQHKLLSGRIDNQGGLAPSYVRTISCIIKAVLRYACDEGLCEPMNSSIYKPSVRKKELSILSKTEQKTLEEYLQNNITPTNVGLLLSLYAGLRIGEVCALSWSDVNLEEKILKVRHTVARDRSGLIIDTPKTASSFRDIPISSKLLPFLEALEGKKDAAYVISDSCGFVKPRTYEYRYHRLLKELNIKDYNYHTLRHTFATRCIEAGVDVKSLSEILGHSNVSITLNTYVHSSMEMKRSQLEKLANF